MLDNDRVFCTSDPGTGKTRSVLDAIKQRPGRTLIFCPKSIITPSWGEDIKKFTPELNYAVAKAPNRFDAFNLKAKIVLINHDGAKWVADNMGVLEGFDTLVLDESTFIKNPTAQRSKAVAKIASHFTYRVALTGTPNPQGLTDLWQQMYVLDDGDRLGKSFYKFRMATYTPISKGGFTQWEEKEGAQDAVFGLIDDMNIRYKFEDCIDTPENSVHIIPFELSTKHLALYTKLKNQAVLAHNNATITGVNAAALAGKLMQAASGSVYDEDGVPQLIASERYELIIDLIEQREQCVVAFLWKHQKTQLIELATKRGVTFAVIDGTATTEERNHAVEMFQAGLIKAIFAHPKSASHGLTLTNGTTTIWCSPTYSVEHFEQFNRRIYRAGQTRKTETLLITATGTIDEKAYEILTTKHAKMTNLLELLTHD